MALNIQKNIELAHLTTFQIGGNAKYFVVVNSNDELCEALEWAKSQFEDVEILSGGSNVLVSDEGYDGLIIQIKNSSHTFDGNTLTAEAGCNLLSLIREASEYNLGGWENLAGIPGSIGGAVRGNAGAFGTEIKDVATRVWALHRETYEIQVFDNHACEFSYRHSFFKDNAEWIVIRVQLALESKSRTESDALIEKTIAERERRHLQNVKAAGSYFMNPTAPQTVIELFEKERNVQAREGRVPAGWLIEKAGMKGAMHGGAMASLQHPNYLVNTGNATAADVKALALEIKEKVSSVMGVILTEEAAQI